MTPKRDEQPTEPVVPPALQEQLSALLANWVNSYTGGIEAKLAEATAANESLRKDRDEALRQVERLVDLRDAALRWDTDHYSPRLKNVISVFRRQEVAKR